MDEIKQIGYQDFFDVIKNENLMWAHLKSLSILYTVKQIFLIIRRR